MKATGIVKKLDSLGRITIPKNLRDTLDLHTNDLVELWTEEERELFLKKLRILPHYELVAKLLAESAYETINFNVYITDRSNVIAHSGIYENKVLNMSISKDLIRLLDKKKVEIIQSTEKSSIPIVSDDNIKHMYLSQIISPIIVSENVVGGVILEAMHYNVTVNEVHIKLVEFLELSLEKSFTVA